MLFSVLSNKAVLGVGTYILRNSCNCIYGTHTSFRCRWQAQLAKPQKGHGFSGIVSCGWRPLEARKGSLQRTLDGTRWDRWNDDFWRNLMFTFSWCDSNLYRGFGYVFILVQSSQCLTVNFTLTLTSVIEFWPKILGISIQEKLACHDNSKIAVPDKFL